MSLFAGYVCLDASTVRALVLLGSLWNHFCWFTFSAVCSECAVFLPVKTCGIVVFNCLLCLCCLQIRYMDSAIDLVYNDQVVNIIQSVQGKTALHVSNGDVSCQFSAGQSNSCQFPYGQFDREIAVTVVAH